MNLHLKTKTMTSSLTLDANHELLWKQWFADNNICIDVAVKGNFTPGMFMSTCSFSIIIVVPTHSPT